ncbi:MAG: glycosyltransferase, partial [Candidatus Diapherotrites archaeon]|nr:glycosyltransferase [Candidatus Diapherotrites archaeon]
MGKPKVSVIMSVFNAEKYVKDAVQSVLDQTLKDFEFIIVNDNSTDSTHKIIKKFKDKRIRYFKRNYNSGKGHSVNLAFKKARGEYGCIFDADDLMVNYKLEVASGIMDKHKECGLVYGNAWIMDENSEITGPFSFPTRDKRHISQPFPNYDFSLKKLSKKNFIPQGTTTFRMSAIRKVGGIDENLTTGEDWDLWLRIAEHFEVRYLPVP